jgi:N-acetylmuramoyl-L-alanine amidase
MVVAICAGHSIRSPGAVSAGVNERDICRRIVDSASIQGRERGWTIVDPMSDTVPLGYPAYLLHRLSVIERAAPDVAVDVHLNAWTDPDTNHSLVVYGDEHANSLRSAQCVANEFADLPWRSQGVRTDADLGRRLAFVRRPTCPSIIVEPLFLTNPAARSWIGDSDNVDLVASMIVNGIGRCMCGDGTERT